jgi:hypothetical protein
MIDRTFGMGTVFASSAVLLMALAGCGSSEDAASAPVTAVGIGGRLSFAVTPQSPIHEGPNDLLIAVHDVATDAPLAGASLDVSPFMAAMAHDAGSAPEVVAGANGSYAVDDLVFSMPGVWEVRMHAVKDDVADGASVTFDVP